MSSFELLGRMIKASDRLQASQLTGCAWDDIRGMFADMFADLDTYDDPRLSDTIDKLVDRIYDLVEADLSANE